MEPRAAADEPDGEDCGAQRVAGDERADHFARGIKIRVTTGAQVVENYEVPDRQAPLDWRTVDGSALLGQAASSADSRRARFLARYRRWASALHARHSRLIPPDEFVFL